MFPQEFSLFLSLFIRFSLFFNPPPPRPYSNPPFSVVVCVSVLEVGGGSRRNALVLCRLIESRSVFVSRDLASGKPCSLSLLGFVVSPKALVLFIWVEGRECR